MWKWNTYGPPQVWQFYLGQRSIFLSPIRRLHRAGKYGLIVGPGCTMSGGLSTKIAEKYEKKDMCYLKYNAITNITKAYACQYAFDFDA